MSTTSELAKQHLYSGCIVAVTRTNQALEPAFQVTHSTQVVASLCQSGVTRFPSYRTFLSQLQQNHFVISLQVGGNLSLTIANLSDAPVRHCIEHAQQTGHIIMRIGRTGGVPLLEMSLDCPTEYAAELLRRMQELLPLSQEYHLADLARSVEWLYRAGNDIAIADAPAIHHRSICGIVCT